MDENSIISFFKSKRICVIKHFPHISLDVPKGYIASLSMSMMEFEKYNLKMSDVGVDRLFRNFESWLEVKPRYSRLFCDVERYKDDEKEPMSKFGQGYRYSQMYDGKRICRTKVDGRDFMREISDYYDRYHKRVTKIVNRLIKTGRDVLILDIHSYSDELALSLGKRPPFPDVCIGVNRGYCDQEVLNYIIRIVLDKGLSYEINEPYSGSFLPANLIENEGFGKVFSIMIEINKKVYL